jgi:hypothetical protein
MAPTRKVAPDNKPPEFTLGKGGVPWSCKANNVYIVSSRASDEVYEGPWKKSLRLRVELDSPLPVSPVPAGMPAASIEYNSIESKPLICIDHPIFNGLWNILVFSSDRHIVHCLIPQYETDVYKPNDYHIIMPKEPDQNICATRTIPDESCCVSGSEVLPSITLAPPLCFHTRMTVFAIDEISTIGQTFRTSNYCELKLKSFVADEDDDLVETILGLYGFEIRHIM